MIRSSRNGFSLIEALVVICIIAIVISFLLPATRRVRVASARMACQNNLKQVMLALQGYESNGRPVGFLGTAHTFPPGCFGPGTTPEDRLSWMVAVLPYLEQGPLYQQFDLEKGYAGNLPAAQTRIKTFLCPSSQEATESADAVTSYVALSGIGLDAARQPAGAPGNGFMGYDRRTTLAMVEDGASNTIALMETRSGPGTWARGGASNVRGFDPADVPLFGDQRPFGGHANGMHAAMVDGSVRFLSSSIEPKQLAAAITIAGGESVDLD